MIDFNCCGQNSYRLVALPASENDCVTIKPDYRREECKKVQPLFLIAQVCDVCGEVYLAFNDYDNY
jgi:hypothetical protein